PTPVVRYLSVMTHVSARQRPLEDVVRAWIDAEGRGVALHLGRQRHVRILESRGEVERLIHQLRSAMEDIWGTLPEIAQEVQRLGPWCPPARVPAHVPTLFTGQTVKPAKPDPDLD